MTKRCKDEITEINEDHVEEEEEEGEILPSMIVFDLDDCLWTPEMHELYDMPSIPVRGNLNPIQSGNGSVKDKDDNDDTYEDEDYEGDDNTTTNKRRKKKCKETKKQSKRTSRSSSTASSKNSNDKSASSRSTSNYNNNDEEEEVGVVGLRVPGTSQSVYLYKGARLALREIALNVDKYKDVIIAVASTSLQPSYSHQCINNIDIIPGLTMRDMFQYDEIGRDGHLTSRKTTHFESLHRKSHIPYDEMLFFDDCNWGDHVGDLAETYGVVGQRTPHGLQIEEFFAGLEKYRKSKSGRTTHGGNSSN